MPHEIEYSLGFFLASQVVEMEAEAEMVVEVQVKSQSRLGLVETVLATETFAARTVEICSRWK